MDIAHPKYSIQLRPTQANDVNAIFEIRKLDDVAKTQFRLTALDTPENYVAFYIHEKDRGGAFHSWTILDGDRVIGHITAMQSQQAIYRLGFNLHPDYWGHGVMAGSLRSLMNDLYTNGHASAIFCDCFADNDRCRNMLLRLGLVPGRMDWLNRFYFWWLTLCTRPIIRHKHLRQMQL